MEHVRGQAARYCDISVIIKCAVIWMRILYCMFMAEGTVCSIEAVLVGCSAEHLFF